MNRRMAETRANRVSAIRLFVRAQRARTGRTSAPGVRCWHDGPSHRGAGDATPLQYGGPVTGRCAQYLMPRSETSSVLM